LLSGMCVFFFSLPGCQHSTASFCVRSEDARQEEGWLFAA
jgi:hypothetical protein